MSQKSDSPDHTDMEKGIILSFPILGLRVMVHLFKTVVNTGLLLPIYIVPADFYCMMCGLAVLMQRSLNLLIL